MLTSFDPGVWLRMDPYVEGRYSSLEVSLRDKVTVKYKALRVP